MNTFESGGGQDIQPLRLTFSVILAALVLMLGFGALGGFVVQYFFREPAPLPSKEQQIVTTVQNITLSPNLQRGQMVEKVSKSLVTVAQKTPTTITPLGVGTILTNDGYIVVLDELLPAESTELVVVDSSNTVLPVTIIGRDAMFGLAYIKLASNVAVPVEVVGQEATTGSFLTSISRSFLSSEYVVGSYELQQYTVPAEEFVSRAGWQRLAQGVFSVTDAQVGTPLFTDEGKLAAVALSLQDGYALRASDIQESLNRVTTGKHQYDPLETAGLDLRYGFAAQTPGETPVFTVTVFAVTPASPAAVAGIQKGDALKAVNTEVVEWKKNVSSLLEAPLPITLTLSRQGVERTAIIPNVVTP